MPNACWNWLGACEVEFLGVCGYRASFGRPASMGGTRVEQTLPTAALGKVRVGMLPGSVPALASPIFLHGARAFPAVMVHLSDGASAQLDELLRDGRIGMFLETGKTLAGTQFIRCCAILDQIEGHNR